MKFEEWKQKVNDDRNKIKRCPCCNANIEDRKVIIYKELVEALYEVYIYCGKKGKHKFETKEVRHLFTKNAYARFGDFVRFGGIIYRPKESNGKSRKALYGINMARAKEFFQGKREIPVQITLNQISNEIVGQVMCKVTEFPPLVSLLRSNGLYDYELDMQPRLLN